MWILTQFISSPLVIALLSLSSSILKNKDSSAPVDFEVSNYTDDEKNTIKLFREVMNDALVQEYQWSDDYLIQWLQESNMDVNSASQMLRRNLEWRKEFRMDSILDNTSYNLKGSPCAVVGFDKNGGPIMIFKVMEIELRNLLTINKVDKIRNQAAHCIERYVQASIHGGSKHVDIRMTPGTAIVDLQRMTIKQHACLRCNQILGIKLYQDLGVYSSQYFPRISKRIVLINASRYTRPLIEMTRPFISPYFQQILHIFGSDKEEWTRFLLSIISEEELLQEYGGSKLNYDM